MDPYATRYEYIWIDGNGGLRSKTRFVNPRDHIDGDPPKWNYDGSSTNQAPGYDSEIELRPIAMYDDPFGRENKSDKLLLCDTYTSDGIPAKWNNRSKVKKFVERCHENHDLWFGFEMEYFLVNNITTRPLGCPADVKSRPPPQGGYYCGVGANVAYGRDVKDEHADACIRAGLNVAGTNGEVAPGQWEIQIGIAKGIDAADQLWMARYLLQRVAEKHNMFASFVPKINTEYNGSGLHTNVSTKDTRHHQTGTTFIKNAMTRFEQFHQKHIQQYGNGNNERMTGNCETASYDNFSYGVADRNASIRIPRTTHTDGYGYFEDRRPAANADPYLVINCIAESMYA